MIQDLERRLAWLAACGCLLLVSLVSLGLSVQPAPAQSLPWLGGAWNDAGQRASITQDQNDRNRLVFTNRLGWNSNGYFANPTTVIAADWEGGLRGTLQDNGNTIRWANGTVWYRATTGGSGQTLPSLAGAWNDAGQRASITQDQNDRNRLVFTNRLGWNSNGSFADASTVIAADWEGGLRGSLQDNGNTIRWANGTVWYRLTTGGGGQTLDLGRSIVWVIPDVCVGIWTRTQPKIYDAVTVCQGPGNTSSREVLTVESYDGRSVVIVRPNYGRYRGTLSTDRKTIRGTCDWAGCAPGLQWTAYIDWDWNNSPPR